jgi:hypothetical protein
MKDLIIQALNSVYQKAINADISETKRVEKTISIENVKPIDIASFMRENNVPDDAELRHSTCESIYDACEGFYLSWIVEKPLSESEKEVERLKSKKRFFSNYSFQAVHGLLTENGYKRVGVNTALLTPYSKDAVYEMFLDKDFDGLVKYYSLYFKKDLDN